MYRNIKVKIFKRSKIYPPTCIVWWKPHYCPSDFLSPAPGRQNKTYCLHFKVQRDLLHRASFAGNHGIVRQVKDRDFLLYWLHHAGNIRQAIYAGRIHSRKMSVGCQSLLAAKTHKQTYKKIKLAWQVCLQCNVSVFTLHTILIFKLITSSRLSNVRS